jgi:hypothetical protein
MPRALIASSRGPGSRTPLEQRWNLKVRLAHNSGRRTSFPRRGNDIPIAPLMTWQVCRVGRRTRIVPTMADAFVAGCCSLRTSKPAGGHMKITTTVSPKHTGSMNIYHGRSDRRIRSYALPPFLLFTLIFLIPSCIDSSEAEESNDLKTSTTSEEVATGECWATTTCQYGQVQCHGYSRCEPFDDGSGDPRYHYLANLSYTNTFGHADQGFFAVRNTPGSNAVRCDGVTTSCSRYPISATITISNYSAADGPWPRTVPVGQTFMVQFANQTTSTLFPALQLSSASSGSVVDPNYIGLIIVGRDPHGGQL